MALSFLSPSRAVLLVTDDALCVYDVTARACRLVDIVPWEREKIETLIAELLRKDCKGKSVVILNDATDQHFKGGQRMPNVGVMDKANVLRRKLQVAFPNYPVRGALPVKRAPGSDSPLAKKGTYLFAAIPLSETVSKAIEAVTLSMSSIAGLFLLPVESADLVQAIASRQAGKKKKTPRWTVFMGQHRNGGMRQVIIRDGQLAMTRMTPVIDTDSDHEGWAREVFQEFKATLSYLSRFGFSSDDGINVVVVAHPQAGDVLETLIDIPCNYTSYTVNQLAQFVGVPLGVQDSPRYADGLHVAWAGRKTKFTLPMSLQRLDKVAQMRQAVSFLFLLFVLGAGYLAWQLFQQSQALFAAQEDVGVQQSHLVRAEASYREEIARMEGQGLDIELIRGTLGAYDSFEKGRMKILPFVKSATEALGGEVRLDSFALNKHTPPKVVDPYGYGADSTEEKKSTFEALFKMTFPQTVDLEKGVQEVKELSARLQKAFPDYEVTIKRNLIGLDYSAQFSGASGVSAKDVAKEDYVAEIQITGDVQ